MTYSTYLPMKAALKTQMWSPIDHGLGKDEESFGLKMRVETTMKDPDEATFTRRGGRPLFACPISKASRDTGNSQCTYRGRGFKSMTAVMRHIQNQHKRYVEKCDRCALHFFNSQELEHHRQLGNCPRAGIQKGVGQVREWKALFTAICPGVPLPRTPYYDQNSSTPTARGVAASLQQRRLPKALDCSPISIPSPGQHRQSALQTIDILRGNIINYPDVVPESEKKTMMDVVQALLPLIQRTAQAPVPQPFTQQAQPSTTSAPVAGPAFPDLPAEALQPVEEQPQLLSDMGNATFDQAADTDAWLQIDYPDGLFDTDSFQNNPFEEA